MLHPLLLFWVTLLSTSLILLLPTSHAQPSEWVQSAERCFLLGQPILVDFHDLTNPTEDHWIGMYPAEATSPFEEPIVWQWTCGGQSEEMCQSQSIPTEGTIIFDESSVRSSWPLLEGDYRAVLASDVPLELEEYIFLDVSPRFRVSSDCTDQEQETEEEVEHNSSTSRPITNEPSARPSLRPSNNNRQPEDTPTTSAPTNPPSTSSQQSSSSLSAMAQVIQNAKTEIAAIINGRPILRALYLRMIFHDCIGGGCDGCINLDNIDNGGLQSVMFSLRDLEGKYAEQGLSRADLWVLATFIGVEQAMPPEARVEMPFRHYGRIDCTDRRTEGPDPPLCSANLGTEGVLKYFEEEFDFTPQETAAIMGAHTIGVARRNILGFDGPNGWVPKYVLL